MRVPLPCSPPLRLALLALFPLSGCAAPELTLLSAFELEPLLAPASVDARAGGFSARWGDRSLWLYGDTVLNTEGEDGASWRNNSSAWTTDTTAADGVDGFSSPSDALAVPLELFPVTEAEAAYNAAHAGANCSADDGDPCGSREVLWPGPLVVDGDRAFAFWWKVHGEPGAVTTALGVGLSPWSDPDSAPTRPVIDPSAAEPTVLFPDDGNAPGNAAVISEGFLWSFGCPGRLEKRCRLLRAPVDQALDPAAWQWYSDGTSWNSDPAFADTLFLGSDRMSLGWNEALERWLVIYSEPQQDRVVARQAKALLGPWSEPLLLFETEPAFDDSGTDAGLGHPEFSEGTTEYVTYVQPTAEFTSVQRLVAVELGWEGQ